MDLRDALNVLKKLRERGDKETKIGIVVKNIVGMVGNHPLNTIVLFRKSPESSELVIELPMTHYEILERTSSGSKNITKGTIVGVPPNYVEEIIFE